MHCCYLRKCVISSYKSGQKVGILAFYCLFVLEVKVYQGKCIKELVPQKSFEVIYQ